MGSEKGHYWCSSQEDPYTLGVSKYKFYVLHLSNESFPKNVSDLEGVKNVLFSPLYPDFNVWKKVVNYSSVQDNRVLQKLPTFFQTLKSGYSGENKTFLGNDSYER